MFNFNEFATRKTIAQGKFLIENQSHKCHKNAFIFNRFRNAGFSFIDSQRCSAKEDSYNRPSSSFLLPPTHSNFHLDMLAGSTF